MQTKSSVEDFSSLDVKSKATTNAKKPQESSRNKAEQDAWELLNSQINLLFPLSKLSEKKCKNKVIENVMSIYLSFIFL